MLIQFRFTLRGADCSVLNSAQASILSLDVCMFVFVHLWAQLGFPGFPAAAWRFCFGFVKFVMRRCGLISPSDSRRYLPVLRDFPAKFIYDPWNAPEDVQLAAKCVIGVDYPKPMVNHAEASRLNIERMRQIYQQLSRYRGLSKSAFNLTVYKVLHFLLLIFVQPSGLLATVPSNHMEDVSVNEARGSAVPRRMQSSVTSHRECLKPDVAIK